jgi:glycosyltransferase involved in cell wall biosynthesis
MTRNPKISFCIPTYNNATFLERCIDSVLAQDYDNKELIVVNDCSTDTTGDILKKYAPNATIISNSYNRGQAASTNRAIYNATGEYCAILHSDDYLLPEFSTVLPALLNNNPNVGIAVGERKETDTDDNVQSIAPFYDADYMVPGPAQAEVFMFASFLPCQVLARRQLLLDIGMTNHRYEVNLDGLLWFECALMMDVAYTQTAVCCYRRHDDSTTGNLNQTPDHIAKVYSTLKEMHRIGEQKNLSTARFAESETRLAEVALKYAPDSLLADNIATTRKYLDFALFFDSTIASNSRFKMIDSILKSNISDSEKIKDMLGGQFGHTTRNTSYSPPAGAKKFNKLEIM